MWAILFLLNKNIEGIKQLILLATVAQHVVHPLVVGEVVGSNISA